MSPVCTCSAAFIHHCLPTCFVILSVSVFLDVFCASSLIGFGCLLCLPSCDWLQPGQEKVFIFNHFNVSWIFTCASESKECYSDLTAETNIRLMYYRQVVISKLSFDDHNGVLLCSHFLWGVTAFCEHKLNTSCKSFKLKALQCISKQRHLES